MSAGIAFFPLSGGLDLVTPAVALRPGAAIAALNYEPLASGYRRLRGFERFNGKTVASQVTQWGIIYFTGASAVVAPGTHLGCSTGTYTTVGEQVILSGTVGAGTAAGYYVVYRDTVLGDNVLAASNFPNGSVLTFAGSGFTGPGTITTPLLVVDAVPAGRTAAQLLAAVRSAARTNIEAVPGSGPVRGVFFFDNEVYAVRDNAGGTAAILHRGSSSGDGWEPVSMGEEVLFREGATEIVPGDTITSSSGGSLVVAQIVVLSGSWGAGTATGAITAVSHTGTFAYNDDLLKSAVKWGEVDGAIVSSIFAPGGSYSFLTNNFSGSVSGEAMFITNGVNAAIQYDGSTALPIYTGLSGALNKPTLEAVHRQSLFLAFPGGSVQYSPVGEPLNWSGVDGAGEIGIGDEVTGFINLPNALGILGEKGIYVLYGNDSTDYQLETLTREAGALRHTAQRLGEALYMDNRGLRKLTASQAYGNFSMGTLTKLVEPLLRDYREDGVEPVASLVARESDQYWVFFDNGTGLIVYMGGKTPAVMPVNLGKVVSCVASVEFEGQERLFMGCTDGFVYEMNVGTSFDGGVIEHYVRLPFNHFGSPQQYKRFFKASVDVEASGTTTLIASFDLNGGSVTGIPEQTLNITTGGGAIDGLGTNELYYASQVETQAEIHIQGMGKNISAKIGGSAADEEPHTLTGVTYHVLPRGQQR